jgi:hypothetical protein
MLTDEQVAELRRLVELRRNAEGDAAWMAANDAVCHWAGGNADALLSAHADAVRLREALDSAARTAHGYNKAFCYGTFEECPNCRKWRDALRPAEQGGGA